ncbi:MAG: VanZ family protein [Burkholderiaceae bacterium]
MAESGSRVAVALLACLAFVAYQSLAGGVPVDCVVPLTQQPGRLSWSDGIANFAAYLPLGLLAGHWLSLRRRGAPGWLALLAAAVAVAAFSLTMETVQACLDGRVSSWFDLATNSAGGASGIMLVRLVSRGHGVLSGRAGGGHPLAQVRAVLFWPVLFAVGAWLLAGLSPWRFTFDVGTVRANLAFLRGWSHWSGPDPWVFARHLCGWLAVAVSLRALWPARLTGTLVLAGVLAVSVVLQLLLVRRALSLDELAAMLCALPLAGLLPGANSRQVRAGLLALLALASVCAYQLAPGRGRALAAGFDWLPQLGRGGLIGALELSLFFGWLALSVVLALRWRAACGLEIRRQRLAWPVAVVAVLFATEVAQLWIPGRLPDVSPPLLAALAYAIGWALFGAASPPRAGLVVTGPAKSRSRRPSA